MDLYFANIINLTFRKFILFINPMLKELYKLILQCAYNSNTGHISSNLSIADLVYCVYEIAKIQPKDFYGKKNNDRDRFILSKGHASLALYVVLYLKGFISQEQLFTYGNHNGTKLAVHPKHYVTGIEFSTGSLGQGITFAVGCALAGKIENSQRKIYCLISDGEINEGSCWEALWFASHHNLNNLVLLYDNNSLQALGETRKVLNNDNVLDKISTFGLNTLTVDGHNHNEIKNALSKSYDKPTFIEFKTIAGKRVSFMENSIAWHYKTMTKEEYEYAINELDNLKI